MNQRYDRIRVLFIRIGDEWRIGAAMEESSWEVCDGFNEWIYKVADDFTERWLLVPRDWIQGYLKTMDMGAAPGAHLIVADKEEPTDE